MALNEDDGPGPCQPQSGSGSLKSGARVGGDTVTVPSTADMSTQSAMLALPLLSCEQAGALDGAKGMPGKSQRSGGTRPSGSESALSP